MPWNHRYSPLDHTIDALDRLSVQLRRELDRGEPLTVEDFRAIQIFVDRLARELKPLQELTIQEQS